MRVVDTNFTLLFMDVLNVYMYSDVLPYSSQCFDYLFNVLQNDDSNGDNDNAE